VVWYRETFHRLGVQDVTEFDSLSLCLLLPLALLLPSYSGQAFFLYFNIQFPNPIDSSYPKSLIPILYFLYTNTLLIANDFSTSYLLWCKVPFYILVIRNIYSWVHDKIHSFYYIIFFTIFIFLLKLHIIKSFKWLGCLVYYLELKILIKMESKRNSGLGNN
jgi:hypothetical protein